MMTETQFIALHSVTSVALVAIIAAVCVSDARVRRIPNALVLSGLVIAFGWHVIAPEGVGVFDKYTAGGLGFLSALYGAAVCFGFFLVLHVLKVMGAGDVKLMAFMGAVFGIGQSLNLILMVFLCGGVLALARMTDRHRFQRVMANMKLIVLDRIAAPAGGAALFDPQKDTAERLPFALAICSAAVLLALAQQQGINLPWSVGG